MESPISDTKFGSIDVGDGLALSNLLIYISKFTRALFAFSSEAFGWLFRCRRDQCPATHPVACPCFHSYNQSICDVTDGGSQQSRGF